MRTQLCSLKKNFRIELVRKSYNAGLHSKIEQGDQEDSDGGVHWYVGVVPTQATKLYE
jgi:hypothetical protein